MDVSQTEMTRELALSPRLALTLPPVHDDRAISRIMDVLPRVCPHRGVRRGPRGFRCNHARIHGGGRGMVPVYWHIYPHGTSQPPRLKRGRGGRAAGCPHEPVLRLN